MPTLLAIDASTEACSAALYRDGEVEARWEHAPRRHNQRLLAMLADLLPGGPRAGGVDAVAWACGPGSFTGLRIAASAVQGICFALDCPALPVSTLAGQVQTALRQGLLVEGQTVFSCLDAQIGELYWATYRAQEGLAVPLTEAAVCRPEALQVPGDVPPVAIGSGLAYLERLPAALQAGFVERHAALLPDARDLLPLALADWEAGRLQVAEAVCPVYVRDEISWKKLSEQGPAA